VGYWLVFHLERWLVFSLALTIFPKYLHGDDIIAVPLNVNEEITVGVLKHKDLTLTRLGEIVSGKHAGHRHIRF